MGLFLDSCRPTSCGCFISILCPKYFFSAQTRGAPFSCSLCKSKQRHQVMYCIDCCRASAAPLASGSANKSDLIIFHKMLYISSITRYYHRFKYITTSLPRMCSEQKYLMCCHAHLCLRFVFFLFCFMFF